jgi:hypothetical protein
LPIFKSEKENLDTWIMGNQFLENYYVVFDMTPYDERN